MFLVLLCCPLGGSATCFLGYDPVVTEVIQLDAGGWYGYLHFRLNDARLCRSFFGPDAVERCRSFQDIVGGMSDMGVRILRSDNTRVVFFLKHDSVLSQKDFVNEPAMLAALERVRCGLVVH